MLTKGKVFQLLFMLTVLLALFFWKTFDSSENKQVLEETDISMTKPLVNVVRCDYQEACEFINEQGISLLSIKDLPIKAEEWINFELTVPNENSVINSAQIVGKSMFMGKIPVNFKQSGSTQFSGKAIVATCMHDEMIWTVEIMIENAGEQQLLAFDFLVKK